MSRHGDNRAFEWLVRVYLIAVVILGAVMGVVIWG